MSSGLVVTVAYDDVDGKVSGKPPGTAYNYLFVPVGWGPFVLALVKSVVYLP